MTLHHAYLTAMTVLFVVVFALMIHSLITHRAASGAPSAKTFGGPGGRGQWLWALVPLAIVAAVDVALIELPGSPPAAARSEAAGASADHSPPAGEAAR